MEAFGELIEDSLPLLGLPTEHQGLEEAPAEGGPGSRREPDWQTGMPYRPQKLRANQGWPWLGPLPCSHPS
jgi:hypothetical protein